MDMTREAEDMPIKAVQQIMLGTVTANEAQARDTLAAIRRAV